MNEPKTFIAVETRRGDKVRIALDSIESYGKADDADDTIIELTNGGLIVSVRQPHEIDKLISATCQIWGLNSKCSADG